MTHGNNFTHNCSIVGVENGTSKNVGRKILTGSRNLGSIYDKS